MFHGAQNTSPHPRVDDIGAIQKQLLQWSDSVPATHLILTTGGTGFSPRDVTPEAVGPLLDRRAPGLVTAMITKSLEVTPMAMLSRPVSGIRKQTIIVTFPGSRKAAQVGFIGVGPKALILTHVGRRARPWCRLLGGL